MPTEALESRVLMSTYHLSPNGNDNNPGTPELPWRTLPKAVFTVAAGDEVVLHAGTYASGVTFNQPNLLIRAAEGEARPVLTAPMNLSNVENALRVGVNGSGTTIRGLEVTGGYYYALKLESEWGYGPAAKNVTIEDCVLHDSGRDVVKVTPGCDDAVIRRNEIYNSGKRDGSNAEGIDNVNADRMIVQDNYIHDIATNGLYAKGGASNCVIERNRIENTGNAGVTLGYYTDAEFFDADNTSYYESIDSVVRNNVIVNTTYAGVGLYGALRPGVYNNTLVNVAKSAQAGIVFAPAEVATGSGDVVTPCRGVSIFNNIVVTPSRASVQIRDGSLEGSLSIDNNRYFATSGTASFRDDRSGSSYNGDLAGWRDHVAGDRASAVGDPLLGPDRHLTAASPAIDAGRDLTSAGVHDDVDGQVRPSGAGWDVGADEFRPLFTRASLVQFTSRAYRVSEASGQVILRVRRLGRVGDTASVNFAVTPGTATPDADYTPVTGTLVFRPGETFKLLPVRITDDAVAEPDETFSVSLSSPSHAALGWVATTTVTIANDDAGPAPTLVRQKLVLKPVARPVLA